MALRGFKKPNIFWSVPNKRWQSHFHRFGVSFYGHGATPADAYQSLLEGLRSRNYEYAP